MPDLTPVVLQRKFVPKVWGGHRLADLFSQELPGDEPIGETWEVYDRPDGSSGVAGGGSLRELMERDPVGLLGDGVAGTREGRFPLLLKFIDAREALSVQVHPDDAQAEAKGDQGKTEAWVVLATGPDARIIRGLRPETDAEAFRRDAASAAVEQHLWSFTPKVGDCIFVPAGTVHAIGPDVVVFEVQQNSDITYRLYDWGRPREVHVEDALQVSNTAADQPAPDGRPVTVPVETDDGGHWLVKAEPFFRLRHYAVGVGLRLRTDGAFKLATVIKGQAAVGWRSGGQDEPCIARQGDTVLVPASCPEVYLSAVGETRVLISDPGR